MKYTQIPADTFKNLVMNAGILVKNFTPATGAITDLLGATSGGVNFTATPTYTDQGDGIDNCPKNMKELKKLDSWEAKMAGTFLTVTPSTAKMLVGAGDIDSADATKVVPRNDILASDFNDIWWVGDYSDENTGDNAGFMAIHLMNTLSTGGFAIQSGDKAKGTMTFEFTAHYSMAEQETVPFEIYIKQGA